MKALASSQFNFSFGVLIYVCIFQSNDVLGS
jgi:hypothetical protein